MAIDSDCGMTSLDGLAPAAALFHSLADPVRLVRTPDYRGCTSWVDLPVDPRWADPVHDTDTLNAITARVRDSVG